MAAFSTVTNAAKLSGRHELNQNLVGLNYRVSRAHAARSNLAVTAGWTKLTSQKELSAAGGRVVIKTEQQGKVLVQEYKGEVYAVSNKCPHLGLPLQGKILTAEITDAGCLVCPAHKSAFDIKTGEPKGEWCPGMPSLPLIGKPMTGDSAPLPTYNVRVTESGEIEVEL
mmetsp:Transcript_48261/g.89862  ORF Transcript_48261/g.89862 Transcript_48261/m.89862 type:complete len:169 (-) Transcript_48261:218-724(-)